MSKPNFYAVIAIVTQGQEAALLQQAKAAGVLGCTVIPCRGTVTREMFDILGLEHKERSVVHTICRAGAALPTMKRLSDYFHMHRAGHGVVFALPILHSKGLSAMFHLRDDYRQKTGLAPLPALPPENEAEEDLMRYEHELLHIIVKNGFADDAMEAARAAGAQGGTIVHGRGLGIHETMHLFGVAIEPEKDILLILAHRDASEAILHAVSEKVGLHQPGQGIAFAVPVGHVMGIAHSLGNQAE